MDLDNTIDSGKGKKEESGTERFLRELENSINGNDSLYDQIMREQELAPKYKNTLKLFIKEAMKDVSIGYNENFKYIEHNPKTNKYYIYDYKQGKYKRTETTLDYLKKNNLNVGEIYTDKKDKLERDVGIEYLIKDDVHYAIWDLEDA